MNDKDLSKDSFIANYAAGLSVIEMGIGGFLHTLKIPFSGHALSLNQILFMSRLTLITKSKNAALEMSLITAILKSLSPMGKKLTPMLGISSQGLMYTIGLNLFGLNSLGYLLAAVFSSLWAFIQPLLILYLVLGGTILEASLHFKEEIEKISWINLDYFLYAYLSLILIKVILAVIVVTIVKKMNNQDFLNYQEKFIHYTSKKKTSISPILDSLKSALNPLFILGLGLSCLFLFLTKKDYVEIVWLFFRAISLSFILFYFVRIFPTAYWVILFEKMGFKKFSKKLEQTLNQLKNDDHEL